MTDYELLSLFNEVTGHLQDLVGNFLTVLFGFLVTAYLVAPKLGRGMAAVMLFLFTSLAFSQIVEIWLVNNDISGMANEISSRAAAGNTVVAYHGTVQGGGLVESGLTAIQLIATIGATTAAIVFFVYQRGSDAADRSD